METPRNNQKEMLEIKKIVTEVKTVVDELIHRLDLAKKIIYELEDSSRNFQNWNLKKKKELKRWNSIHQKL